MSREDWDNSLARQKGMLSVAEFDEIASVLDYEIFHLKITDLRNQYSNKIFSRCITKLDSTFTSLHKFTQAISSMVQANPQAACLIWGGVLVVLKVDSQQLRFA